MSVPTFLYKKHFKDILGGCGYKPTIYYTDKFIKKKVFADVDINIKNPEASVVLKDSLNEIVLNKFNATLVPKDQADTLLVASLSSISMSVLQYDELGFVSMYRVSTNIKLKIINQKDTKSFSNTGYYDFVVLDGAISSQSQKLEAIKNASKIALDNIVADIVYAGK